MTAARESYFRERSAARCGVMHNLDASAAYTSTSRLCDLLELIEDMLDCKSFGLEEGRLGCARVLRWMNSIRHISKRRRGKLTTVADKTLRHAHHRDQAEIADLLVLGVDVVDVYACRLRDRLLEHAFTDTEL